MKVNTSELYADTSSGQRDRIKLQMERAGFVHNHELKLRRKDGSTVIALETSFATRHRDGKPASYQGFLLDITNSKRAEEEIRRKNRELNALNTMAGLTNRTLNVDEVLSAALTQVIELFGADAGSAYTCDRDRKVLTCRAAAGHNQRIREFLSEVSIGSGILQTIEDGHIETVSMDDPTASADIRELLRREGVAASLGVVLWARGQMAGWVGISWRKPRVFTSEERELMTAVGRQIATSMENARLYEKACLALEDLQHAQEQLLQSEKMSAVGQMISGVAHELNNPLTAILGYTQLLENEPLNDRSRDFMQKIFRQAQRTPRCTKLAFICPAAQAAQRARGPQAGS
jgi:GAF domain-containing protein